MPPAACNRPPVGTCVGFGVKLPVNALVAELPGCHRRPRNGASERSIMKQTGHKSVQMVRRYIREGELFSDNAAGKLGP